MILHRCITSFASQVNDLYLSILAELTKISHKFTSIVHCWPLLFIVKLHSVRNNACLTYSRNRHRGCARARTNRDDFATSFLYLRARKKYLLLLFSVLLILLLFVLSYTHTLSLSVYISLSFRCAVRPIIVAEHVTVLFCIYCTQTARLSAANPAHHALRADVDVHLTQI